jgi:hypothetical protein
MLLWDVCNTIAYRLDKRNSLRYYAMASLNSEYDDRRSTNDNLDTAANSVRVAVGHAVARLRCGPLGTERNRRPSRPANNHYDKSASARRCHRVPRGAADRREHAAWAGDSLPGAGTANSVPGANREFIAVA